MTHHHHNHHTDNFYWVSILKWLAIVFIGLAIISMLLIMFSPETIEMLQFKSKKKIIEVEDLESKNQNNVIAQEDINSKETANDRIEIFLGNWCGACKTFGPIVERDMDSLKIKNQNLEIIIHHCEEESEQKACGPITRVPTVLFFKSNASPTRFPGPFTEEAWISWLKTQNLTC
jgi:thiol-disulfide isomerase/thioredoxin